ncbi:unnamed protein product [Aphanomyces euteiches]
MRWSKNITEEREAPHQMVIGAMDDRLCPLLNLAVYIELLDLTKFDTTFLFGNGMDGDRGIRSLLSVALESSRFRKLVHGNLGTHSIRKGAATYCAKCGIAKDHIELRGRWRGQKKQVDTYIDVERSYPDAKVATCLCGPSGPVSYALIDKTWCTNAFLCERVAPNASRLLSSDVAEILALPLLYAAIQNVSKYDSEFPLIPCKLQQSILHAVRTALNCESDVMPEPVVVIKPVIASGVGGELHILDLGPDIDHSNVGDTSSTALMASLTAQSTEIFALKRRIEEIQQQNATDLMGLRTSLHAKLDRLLASMKRFAAMPSLVHSSNLEQLQQLPDGATTKKAVLSRRPRDLFDLWKEYEFGLAGSIPARMFSAKERGASKFVYCFRLQFWRLVESVLDRGHTRDTAIDAIYAWYGRSKSVTAILTELRKSKPQPSEF